MQKLTLIIAVLICSFAAQAQQILNQVIVLNEGHFNYTTQQIEAPVTVGSYNPQTNVYSAFDTIDNARFATDVAVDGSNIFVAADNQLVKYDLNTHQLISSQTINGVRKLALWNDKILLTRGEYGVSYDSYFQVYNKSDLSFVYQLDTLSGPQYSTDGVVVKDNTAYIAINNGFVWGGAVGIVGRVDLTAQQYLTEIPLGADGINPENIMVNNNKIYTVNNKDYSEASISSVDISNSNVITTNLNNAGGCQGSALVNNHIAFQTQTKDFLGRFDLTSQSVEDSLFINKTIYGMGTDETTHNIYVSETDFTSYGLMLIYSENGNLLNAFVSGVTPGRFAFDYRNANAVNAITSSSQLFVYPNPASNELTIASTVGDGNSIIALTSIDGKILFTKNENAKNFVEHIDLSNFAAGTFLLTVTSKNKTSVQKVVKY